jgi:ferredoxin-NADP reductase
MSGSDTEKFHRATITKRVDFAPELWTIRIQLDGEFKFAPGQYATLGLEGLGKLRERVCASRE